MSHNASKVIESAPALKRLIDLGVDISKWEKKGWNELTMRAAHDVTVKEKIEFLAKILNPGEV